MNTDRTRPVTRRMVNQVLHHSMPNCPEVRWAIQAFKGMKGEHHDTSSFRKRKRAGVGTCPDNDTFPLCPLANDLFLTSPGLRDDFVRKNWGFFCVEADRRAIDEAQRHGTTQVESFSAEASEISR